MYLNKSDIISNPPYFSKYIELCNDNFIEELQIKNPNSIFEDLELLLKLKNQVYENNKWTIKQIIKHCIDTERIMSYRALRIARADKTALPGFEENEFAQNANVQNVSVIDLLEEYNSVRQSTVYLFKSFSQTDYKNIGIASNQEICPLALGYIIIGHPIHHYKIIQERYFPMIYND